MKKILGYTLLLFFLASCTKGFEDLNKPPTTSASIDPGALLAQVQLTFKYHQGVEYQNCTFGSWIQHWNSSNNIPESRYLFNRRFTGYYDEIRNISQIRNHILAGQEDTPEGRTKLAIARIVEIDVWRTQTNVFGDIPYSETALGEKNLIPQPKFDTQESIYLDLIAKLNEAIRNLNTADVSYGKSDLYYGGDVQKWIKYANALKLQIGMTLRYVKPDLAVQVITEALQGPIISSNNDNAMIETSTTYQSSYHPVLRHFSSGSPDNKYLAEAFVNRLLDTKDPRLTFIVEPTLSSHGGEPIYRGKAVAPTDEEMVGVIHDNFSTASTNTFFSLTYNGTNPIPHYVYTYSEICFYKAEIALENWAGLTSSQAEEFYQEGIRAAMALKPFNITDIPQEYIDDEFSFTGLDKEQQLEKIMTQKWILLFGRSIDAFNEWRRTGYPKLTPGNNPGATNGQIPRRAGYPNNELLLNADNYHDAVNRMSHGDSYLSRVWWDVKD